MATRCEVVGRHEHGAVPVDHYGVLAEMELDGDRFGRGGGFDTWDAVAAELYGRDERCRANWADRLQR